MPESALILRLSTNFAVFKEQSFRDGLIWRLPSAYDGVLWSSGQEKSDGQSRQEPSDT